MEAKYKFETVPAQNPALMSGGCPEFKMLTLWG